MSKPSLTPLDDRTDRSVRSRGAGWVASLYSLIGLAFVVVLFSVLVRLTPGARPFATAANFELMLRQTAVIGVAALGMTLIILSGGIDLSVGAVMALSTVVVAQLLVMHVPATLAVLGGILAGAVCGTITGLLITKLRLAPFIVTLGMWGAVRGLAKQLAHNTSIYPPTDLGHDWRVTWLYGLLRSVSGTRAWLLLPAGVWMMLVLAVLVAGALRYTRVGRHIFAIGSNEQTARLCGVNVDRTKLLIYAAGAAFVGLAGVLEFSYISMGDPTTRGGAELDVIAAVVIGGTSLAGGQGSVLGSLVGALIMTIVANGCTKLNLSNSVQEIATGGIIIFAAALDRVRQKRVG